MLARKLAFLIAFCAYVGVACAEVLCCGRGAPPVGARPATPLERRASPWRADVVLGTDPTGSMGPDSGAVNRALKRVKAVAQFELDPKARWLRVWIATPVPVAELCRALAAEQVAAVPALEARFLFDAAGEKGRVATVSRVLGGQPGVVDVEVEVDGEAGVARVWMFAGKQPAEIVRALAAAGVTARAL